MDTTKEDSEKTTDNGTLKMRADYYVELGDKKPYFLKLKKDGSIEKIEGNDTVIEANTEPLMFYVFGATTVDGYKFRFDFDSEQFRKADHFVISVTCDDDKFNIVEKGIIEDWCPKMAEDGSFINETDKSTIIRTAMEFDRNYAMFLLNKANITDAQL